MSEWYKKIKALRLSKNLSQKEFGKLIGNFSQATISNIEDGKINIVTIEMAKNIARILQTDFNELFDIELNLNESDTNLFYSLNEEIDNLKKIIEEKTLFINSLNSSSDNAFDFVLQEFINNYTLIFNIFDKLLKECHNLEFSALINSEMNRFISFEKKILKRYIDIGVFTIEDLNEEISYRNDMGAVIKNINEM